MKYLTKLKISHFFEGVMLVIAIITMGVVGMSIYKPNDVEVFLENNIFSRLYNIPDVHLKLDRRLTHKLENIQPIAGLGPTLGIFMAPSDGYRIYSRGTTHRDKYYFYATVEHLNCPKMRVRFDENFGQALIYNVHADTDEFSLKQIKDCALLIVTNASQVPELNPEFSEDVSAKHNQESWD